MATRSVVCPECGAEVPAGRLSCAACGTLLASVAGSSRRTTYGSGASADGADAPLGDAVDAAAASARRARDAAEWTTGMDAAEDPLMAARPPTPPILKDWSGPMPLGVVTPPTAGSTALPTSWTPTAWTAPEPAPMADTAAAPSAPEPDAPDASRPDAPDAPDAAPLDVESWDVVAADDAPLAHAASAMPPPDVEPSWPPSAAVVGAYVAPAIVPTAAATIDGRPATATSIAAAAVAEGTVTSTPVAKRPDRWYSVPGAAKDAASTPGAAGLFSDLPFRTPRDLPSWAAAVGSLVGAVAFLLPFSSNIVIGGGVDDTWTGRWGLANPANLVVMLLSIALVSVTLIPSRIPVSIRGVVLPILLGGWFLGIVWSYATGPFGLGWGVDAIGIGGIILVVGGALAAARADDPPKMAKEPDAA